MSFCGDVKTELAALRLVSDCCAASELYGMLEGGHAFNAGEISLQTELRETAVLYAALLSRVCGIEPPEVVTIPHRGGGFSVAVPREECRRVLQRFGHRGDELALRLNRGVLECDECAVAYLRGLFLTCGTMSDPEKDYHIELNITTGPLCRDVSALTGEIGIAFSQTCRKGSYLLYLKDGTRIEDLLTMMGASMASLQMMNVQMVKSIRNKVNRVTNCENANIDKTVAAAVAYLAAIEKIEAHGGLSQLPEELQSVAALRYDNPEMSLRELGEQLDPPLSRSGVNHRLMRILSYAEDIE